MDSLFPEFDNRKVCLNCSIPKPITDFTGRHRTKNDWCKKCLKQARKNLPPGKKFCTLCKEIKDIAEFHTDVVHGKTRITSWCNPCDRKHTNDTNKARYNPVSARDSFLRYTYGLTLDEYNAMLEAQGGLCAACGNPETHIVRGKKSDLHIDHDHETGEVRGLLCIQCNTALGLLHENPERLKALLAYIETYVQPLRNRQG